MSKHYVTCIPAANVNSKNYGDAVTLTNGLVALGEKGDPLYGQVWRYEDDGYLAVQDEGRATFRGVPGSLPAVGDSVCCDGHGAVIRAKQHTRKNQVEEVFEGENPTVTVILK